MSLPKPYYEAEDEEVSVKKDTAQKLAKALKTSVTELSKPNTLPLNPSRMCFNIHDNYCYRKESNGQ
jgi:hypothetical protein